MILSQPQGPKGAKGLKKITITHFTCLEEHLNEAITFLKSKKYKGIGTRQCSIDLPNDCPICHQKGNATFVYDKRRNERWVKRDFPIRIYYYHGHGKGKHYIGTWKKGIMHLSPSIKDIRDATAFGSLIKKSRAKLA